MQTVNDGTFHADVRENLEPTVIYFSDDSWCEVCQAYTPIVQTMADRFDGSVRFLKANMDDIDFYAEELGIHTIPSLALFDGGMIISILKGQNPSHEIRLWIQENL
ncbi:MAG: thioredoxin family protein [Gammaproteobacteria bacterium]|nr:thioredoxin family protein [Gammaproteobacteria bacterium]